MATKSSLVFVFLIFSLASAIVRAGPYGFSKGALGGYFETSYFSTKSNFDASGSSAPLINGGQFTEIKMDFSASYDFSNRFSVYGSGSFKRQDAQSTPFGLGTNEKTNTNPSDFFLGANYLLWSGFVSLIPDVSVSVPAYSTPGSDTSPLLGNGAVTETAKVYVTKILRSFLLSGYVGYTNRNQGLSNLIPYGVGAHLELNSFFIEGGLNGSGTMNNDQYANNPIPRLNTDTINDAGSLIYNAVNPSWLNISAILGIRISRQLFVTGGIDTTVTGVDVAQGTRFLVGVGYSTVPTRVTERHGDEISDRDNNSSDFEVDTDSEDKGLPQDDNGSKDSHAPSRSGKIVAPH